MVSHTLLVVFFLSFVFHTLTLSEKLTLKPPEHEVFNSTLYTTCRMRPNTQLASGMPKVYGNVLFKQTRPEERLQVMLKLNSLPASPFQPQAINIHQYGDLSEGCTSTGGHYNLGRVNRLLHPGDFWKLYCLQWEDSPGCRLQSPSVRQVISAGPCHGDP